MIVTSHCNGIHKDSPDTRVYYVVLLDDDALVTGFTLATERLPTAGNGPNYVEIAIPTGFGVNRERTFCVDETCRLRGE